MNVENADLERLLLLAKGAKGAACKAVIEEALSCPTVNVFGELLALPSVKELKTSHAGVHALLEIFAYGTYSQYRGAAAANTVPELRPEQALKLRLLSVCSLAGRTKSIPYATLMEEVEMGTMREIEDLIIEASYRDLVGGKLDPLNQRFDVDFAAGRDIRPQDIDDMKATLQTWLGSCTSVLELLKQKMEFADQAKSTAAAIEDKTAQEVEELRKTLKALDEESRSKDAGMDISMPQHNRSGKGKR